jgi:hypothetical protein
MRLCMPGCSDSSTEALIGALVRIPILQGQSIKKGPIGTFLLCRNCVTDSPFGLND